MTFQQAYSKMKALAIDRYFSVTYAIDDHAGNVEGGRIRITCELWDGEMKKLYTGGTWAQAFDQYEADRLGPDQDIDLSEAPNDAEEEDY